MRILRHCTARLRRFHPLRHPFGRVILVLVTCALVAPLHAQESDHETQLRAKLAKKLAKPFVQNGAWEQDLATAKKRAEGENKRIFAYFTRSFAP